MKRSLSTPLRLIPFALIAVSWLTGCGSDDDTTTSSGGNDPKVVSIASARSQAEGSVALVEGFVTVAPGTFNSATGEMGFAIQDDTGGIYVSMTEGITANLGVKVRAQGKLMQSAQQTVLMAERDAVTVDTATKDIAAKNVTTGEVNEAAEGLLVRVAGKVTKPVVDDAPYGLKVFVDDGSGETQVFVHIVSGSPVIETSSLMVDQMIEVTGLGAQYETTYEVAPRKADDLVKP